MIYTLLGTVELPLLHVVLLWGMGWQGGQMQEFMFATANYAQVQPGHDIPEGVLDENGVTLREALETRKAFTYLYDWGDEWRHKVTVEKKVLLDKPLLIARCIAGENACPPEDGGGAPGYEEFLEAINDQRHPEHKELKKWIGGKFDPTAFALQKSTHG